MACISNFLCKQAGVLLLALFPIYFYLSAFQGVQLFGGESFEYFSLVKKIFFVMLLGLMIVRLAACGRSKGLSFFVAPLLLVFFVLISLAINSADDQGGGLLVRVAFFAFAVFWLQSVMSLRLMFEWCESWYSHKTISFLCLMLILGFFLGPFRLDISNGFGNSRGSFSIWLFQLTCLSLIFARGVKENSFEYAFFLIFLPIFSLQCIVAGRLGMVASLALACYFFGANYGRKQAVFCLLLSFITGVLISWGLSFLVLSDRAIDPMRYSEVFLYVDEGSSQFDYYVGLFDRYISYRFSIASSAFSSNLLGDLLLGVGAGNFKGAISRYPHLGLYDVHNVYLKMLGEYGVFAFVALLVIVLNGIRHAYSYGLRTGVWDFFVVQSLYVAISMFHPDLLLTAIGTSLIYIFSYALVIRKLT